MRAALLGDFQLVLPQQVIAEARRHLSKPAQTEDLEYFLAQSGYEEVPMPSLTESEENVDLVRSERNVPIALALMTGHVDVFVTSDRDFTEPQATAQRFRDRVRIMLPGTFLREVKGWSSEALESIRHRTWQEVRGSFSITIEERR
ncbi:MAG: hypothetical protein EXR50_08720 [Dehalococcoidia bacterium]|nr:hypothetical protein [Dehalococcoidia bacterium]